MRSTTSLLQELVNSYPEFKFVPSDNFMWSFMDSSIFYDQNDADFSIYIIHELAHAILGHHIYDRDIQLLRMETDAWDKSVVLAKKHQVKININTIQDNLDSYRDWLHKRSTCTSCQAIGIQINKSTYECLACHQTWSVNEAKHCRLRRKTI